MLPVNYREAPFSGAAKQPNEAATARYFGQLSGESTETGTDGMDPRPLMSRGLRVSGGARARPPSSAVASRRGRRVDGASRFAKSCPNTSNRVRQSRCWALAESTTTGCLHGQRQRCPWPCSLVSNWNSNLTWGLCERCRQPTRRKNQLQEPRSWLPSWPEGLEPGHLRLPMGGRHRQSSGALTRESLPG